MCSQLRFRYDLFAVWVGVLAAFSARGGRIGRSGPWGFFKAKLGGALFKEAAEAAHEAAELSEVWVLAGHDVFDGAVEGLGELGFGEFCDGFDGFCGHFFGEADVCEAGFELVDHDFIRKKVVPGTGLEPAHQKTPDPKSGASTNSATPARWEESGGFSGWGQVRR